MMIKKSPQENIFGPKYNEKAWERAIRHRIEFLERWLHEHEQRIHAIEEYLKVVFKIEDTGVKDGSL